MKTKKRQHERAEVTNGLGAVEGGLVLGDWVRQLVPSPIIGLRPAGTASSAQTGWTIPRFEDDVWNDLTGAEGSPLTSELQAKLRSLGQCSLFLDALTYPGDGHGARNARATQPLGSARIIEVVVESVAPTTPVVVLAPASVATASSFAQLRRHLAEAGRLSWLIFAGGTLLHLHAASRIVLLVCNIESAPAGQVRLVDIRGCTADDADQVIRAAQERGGGEVGRSLFAARSDMASGSWTYERFTARNAPS